MTALRILGIDTSGKTASAAVLDTEQKLLLGEHTVYTSRTQSQVILPLCRQLLEECRLTIGEIDCLAVAVGPGSYTGLRIGIAAVQGMAMAGNQSCVGVSTLEGMASRITGAQPVLSVMYARADLFYCAKFCSGTRLTEDAMLTIQAAAALMEDGIMLVGEGAAEFEKQYQALENCDKKAYTMAPPILQMQSASGVCMCAAGKTPGTAQELTASYLQAVQVQKKKTDR